MNVYSEIEKVEKGLQILETIKTAKKRIFVCNKNIENVDRGGFYSVGEVEKDIETHKNAIEKLTRFYYKTIQIRELQTA